SRNGRGVGGELPSSAAPRSCWQVEAGAVGTATTTRAGSRRRAAATAGRMVEPGGRPASTRMSTRPGRGGGGGGGRGGPEGGAGGEAVVDQDDHAAGQVGRGPALAVAPLAALE